MIFWGGLLVEPRPTEPRSVAEPDAAPLANCTKSEILPTGIGVDAGMTSSLRLQGLIAIVTGAAKGLGRHVALRLANEGADSGALP